jgi:hypothetical protein
LPERRFNSPKTSPTKGSFLRFHWGMMERLCPWCNRPSRSRSITRELLRMAFVLP